MTRADVLRLALEAGFTWEPINNIADPLERFATLVLEADDGPWKSAVIDRLVIAHILTAEHESDPLKAIQDLLAYHADIAVDPRVSGAAAWSKATARADAKNDSCRLDALEAVAKASGTGVSFDWCRHVEDGMVVEHGYRMMWKHTIGPREKSIRHAIDAAMGEFKP